MTKRTNGIINFEELFQSLGTAYIIFEANDPEFTIIGENEAHAVMAMVKRANVIGKPLLEAFPDTSKEYIEEGKSRLLESIRKVIATGKPDTIADLSYDLKDQKGVLTTKYWEVTHYPVFEGDKVKAVCQQTQDITHSIYATRELTMAQDQLEQALSYSEVGTWMWDLKNNVVADRNLAKLFGIGDGTKQMEVPLSELTKSVHPDDVERVKQTITKSIADKKTSYECEYRTTDFEGMTRWLLARGHIEYNESGEPIRFPGVVVDITERKETENNLHIIAQTNTQFSAALGYKQMLQAIASMIVPSLADWCSIDILTDGKIEQVVIAHKDPKKVKWAQQLRAKQGPVDMNATSGTPWVIRTGKMEYFPVITDEMLQAAAKSDKELKLLRNIGFHSVVTIPLKIDGKSIGALSLISTESHKHFDKNDVEVAQALANRVALAIYNANLFRDAKTEIDERRKLQKELEKLNAALEERVKKRTVQLEKMNDGLQNEIERRHKLESQRLQHFIDLNRTKDEFISLASHQLRTPATGVKQYIGMVIEGMAGDVSDTQKNLLQKAYESNERQLTIVSDLLKVAQVDAGKVHIHQKNTDITELVADVIKEQEDVYAMRKQHMIFSVPSFKASAFVDSDKVRMVVENMIDNASKYSDPGKTIRVSIADEDDMIAVSIEDNGVGVDAKDLDKLFEKFNRIHNHLSNHVGGTGLGLYWAKKIVDLHGGIIKVESVLGKGSTFTICLPKKAKSPVEVMDAEVMYEK